MLPQTAETHCRNVGKLAAINGKSSDVEKTAALAGILHDMGKFTRRFEDYISNGSAKRGEVHHSPTGAIFAYNRWYLAGNSETQTAAQIISMVIRGHHGGLIDCVDFNGDSPYLLCLEQDKDNIFYNEAVDNFLSHCCSLKELDEMFNASVIEINRKITAASSRKAFTEGMLARLILSLIVDADRWDTACFEAGIDPFENEKKADWKVLSSRLEECLNCFPRTNKISMLRGEISDYCLAAAHRPAGIYTLTVPTGGGKTFSSLRFALNHAADLNLDRIFYVIPYNTILEQNAEHIRKALGNYEGILEHYGTFISPVDGEEGVLQEAEHTLITERWNIPIILTSMVQFLDSAFRAENTSARRFNRLAKSVIVFDEIQALPKHCMVLFKKLIKFLASEMHCTVLFCTATQPNLDIETVPLLPENLAVTHSKALMRTKLIDESDIPKDFDEAAKELARLQEQYGSVLVVVNTKAAAKELFERTVPQIGRNTFCVHLSTAMCPAHRLQMLAAMKNKLGREPVFCVSTMLIEAGVNISFPCVVRSFAGLPSIIQAAGRCNRHMEMGDTLGKVFIWKLSEENLDRLPEISRGQKCTCSVKAAPSIGALDTTEAMDWYFKKEKLEIGENALKYLWKEKGSIDITLTDMFGNNQAFWQNVSPRNRATYTFPMRQAFATAGRAFKVIEQDTVLIPVPFEKGKVLIAELCGQLNLKDKIRFMRQAELYSVSVFHSTYDRLLEKGALYPIGDTQLFALRDEYYNEKHLGLIMEPSMADFLIY